MNFKAVREDVPHHHEIVLDVVHGETIHCEILGQQSLSCDESEWKSVWADGRRRGRGFTVPLDDVRVILFEKGMHLLDFLGGERLQDVERVDREVELGPAPPRRVHLLGTLSKRFQKALVIDAEPLAQIAEDHRTIFLQLL